MSQVERESAVQARRLEMELLQTEIQMAEAAQANVEEAHNRLQEQQ